MNKLLVGGAAAALMIVGGPAASQPAPPTPPGVAPGTAPMVHVETAPRAQMMVMSNRDISRADVTRHVAEMFAHFDTNRDGFITRDEVASVHGRMSAGIRGNIERRFDEHAMPAAGAAMFDRLDTNHDGSLSREEFAAAHSRVRERRVIVMRDGAAPQAGGMPPMHRMKMRMHGMGMGMGMGGMRGMGSHLFDMADANHDNRVSLAEAQAAALAHFDRADVNHDGRITREERRQVRQIRIARRTS